MKAKVIKSKPSTQKVSDLCCVINAFEGYCGTYPYSGRPENQGDEAIDRHLAKKRAYEAEQNRQRGLVYSLMLDEATRLHLKSKVPLEELNKALVKAGWEEQHFVLNEDQLFIVVED